MRERETRVTELQAGTLFEVFEGDGRPVWTRFVGRRSRRRKRELEAAKADLARIAKESGPRMKHLPGV